MIEQPKSSDGAVAPRGRLEEAVRTILRGFNEGVFVRSIENDDDPRWAIKLLPFIQALAVAQQALKEAEAFDEHRK